MTTDFDFDARLQARLERLDAAIPTPSAPVVVAGPVGAVAAGRARPRSRRRRLVPLLAAAALLVAATAVTAQRYLYPDEVPEPRLEAALGEVFEAGDGCLSAEEAWLAIQLKLDALGYDDWEIKGRPGRGDGRCTSAGLLIPEHAVLLFPAAGRDLADALENLSAALVERCLNRADAMALLSSVVVSQGVTDFDLRADPWGPGPQIPLDQADAYMAHAAEGCTMYAGMGWNDGGKPQFYLSGPWP